MRRKDGAYEERVNPSIQDKATGLDELNRAIDKICEYRSRLIAKQTRLRGQLVKLQRLDHYENARIWFRKGQYAYLHVSPPGCKRSRTYIGTSAKKFVAIQEAIERGVLVSKIKNSLSAVDKEAWCRAREIFQLACETTDKGNTRPKCVDNPDQR